MLAGLLAPAAARSATAPPARFRSAICAYSFRNQLKDKAMTYEDLIRLAAELQAELHSRIEERGQRREGNRERCRKLLERERHFKGVVLDLQPPELVLKNDRHFLRILLAQEVGNRDSGKLRFERQIKVM